MSVANRIQATLPKLGNNDQTTFIKRRLIGENIRLIDSIINYTANKTNPRFDSSFRVRKSIWHIWETIEKSLNHCTGPGKRRTLRIIRDIAN